MPAFEPQIAFTQYHDLLLDKLTNLIQEKPDPSVHIMPLVHLNFFHVRRVAIYPQSIMQSQK